MPDSHVRIVEAARLLLALVVCVGAITARTATVNICSEGALRTAMAGGGSVDFACDGVIVLTNAIRITNDVTMDASGHLVILSGGNTVRLFDVALGATLVLNNLVLADGRSTNGAAIYNAGTLLGTRCMIRSNSAVGVDGVWYQHLGSSGDGGAVFNCGTAEFRECSFVGNSAAGGKGTSTFMGSHTSGYSGTGGAIHNRSDFTLSLCTFSGNTATGGQGIADLASLIGGGGDAFGGAIYNARTITVSGCAFFDNTARGQQGTSPSTGCGGLGGSGRGGAIYSDGSFFCTNSTIHSNSAVGGLFGYGTCCGTPGGAFGGGICTSAGAAILSFATVAGNSSIGSPPCPFQQVGGASLGGGLYTATGAVLMLQSSIISSNLPGDNNTGPITDSGHNISSDRSCGFTNVGSMNTTDPKLRALAYNGGATPTMALLPSSPAIDAADNSACPRIDQRGVLRPQITACDIGAYELCPDYFYIRSFTPTGPGQFTIWGVGIPLLPFTLLASADLVTWEKVAQGTVTTNGLVEIVTDSTLRFFRIRAP